MVLRLKLMGKLITFDNYLSVRQNQGLAWSPDYKPMRKSALGAKHFLLPMSLRYVGSHELKYSNIYLVLTFLLLSTAILLEVYAFLLLLSSD